MQTHRIYRHPTLFNSSFDLPSSYRSFKIRPYAHDDDPLMNTVDHRVYECPAFSTSSALSDISEKDEDGFDDDESTFKVPPNGNDLPSKNGLTVAILNLAAAVWSKCRHIRFMKKGKSSPTVECSDC